MDTIREWSISAWDWSMRGSVHREVWTKIAIVIAWAVVITIAVLVAGMGLYVIAQHIWLLWAIAPVGIILYLYYITYTNRNDYYRIGR